jgi:hypothetical protein
MVCGDQKAFFDQNTLNVFLIKQTVIKQSRIVFVVQKKKSRLKKSQLIIKTSIPKPKPLL